MTHTPDLIFVYGQLKKNGLGHENLFPCELLATQSISGHALYLDRLDEESNSHEYDPWPYLVETGESRDQVPGEIYKLLSPEDTLKKCDAFEGVEEGLYKRILVEVDQGQAWTYLCGKKLSSRAKKIENFL